MARSSEPKIRIFLIDSHTLFRESLRMLIESHPQFHVVGDAGNCADALPLVAQQQPHVILFQPQTDPTNNLDCIPQLLKATEDTHLVILTGERNVDVNRAAHRGAMGIVFKDQPSDILIKAITKVYDGEAWFDRAAIASVLTQLTQQHETVDPELEKISSLSPREKEIISLIGQGLQNQKIAAQLALSEITVRHHLTSIFAKLGLANRLELIVYAYRHNLAQLPD